MTKLLSRREFLYSLGATGLFAITLSPSSLASQLSGLITPPNLEVLLTLDKESYKSKDLKSWTKFYKNCPQISVDIFNRSADPIWLVYELDGSEVQWRFPHCFFEVFDSKGDSVKFIGGGRCGNMNAIHPNDYTLVHPNESFNPYHGPYVLSNRDIIKPDIYRARFTYSTISSENSEWLGDLGENYTELLDEVPKNIKLSEEINIKVI